MSFVRSNRRWVSAIGLAVSSSILLGPVKAQVAEAPPLPALHLICTGTASKDQEVGTALDFLADNARTERVGTADSISFTINGDDTGEARLPRRLQSAYKEPVRENWFRLINVKRDADEITGQVRLHGMYKPMFRLDRLTGLVTLSGTLGDFSGTCQPYDPAMVERKF